VVWRVAEARAESQSLVAEAEEVAVGAGEEEAEVLPLWFPPERSV
jgi:hypothetical protein